MAVDWEPEIELNNGSSDNLPGAIETIPNMAISTGYNHNTRG